MLTGSGAAAGVLAEGEMQRNFTLLVEALRRGQDRGTVRADVDPGLAVFLMLAANWFLFQGAALVRRNPDLAVTASTDTYAEQLARLLFHGLAPPAGSAREDSP
jgi:hypothetical protein